ncbi:MAG: hypothetical protein AAFY76_06170 [Cyanobacteria bacterium J06649_11]
MIKVLPIFIVSYFLICRVCSAQEDYYPDYSPFDSSGVFKERIIIALGSHVKAIPKDKVHELSPRYIDSLSLEKIDYLGGLLKDNHNLVVVALLYDSFHMMESHRVYGWNPTYMRAKRILTKLIRKEIDPTRIEYYYSDCTSGGHTHKELHSTDKRLELLVYELSFE